MTGSHRLQVARPFLPVLLHGPYLNFFAEQFLCVHVQEFNIDLVEFVPSLIQEFERFQEQLPVFIKRVSNPIMTPLA